MRASLDQVMSSPEFYPVRMDVARGVVYFVRLSRDAYRELAFLDSRVPCVDSEVYAINVDDLLFYDANIGAQSAPVRYIFHPGFACSTLLARYLDLIPGCFVVKEPNLLTQLAWMRTMRPTVKDASSSEATSDWSRLLGAVLRLLTRRYCESDVVIIKAHDGCNILGTELLAAPHGSKIIFLSISLSVFLLSVLKTYQRRVWLHTRLKQAVRDSEGFERLADVDPAKLTDAQAGAYLWLLNSSICQDLQITAPDCISVLRGENVADAPRIAVAEAGSFFGLPLMAEQLEFILADPSVTVHSKDSSLPYDSVARNRDLAQAKSLFRTEIKEGVEWCRQLGDNPRSSWSLS